jgi:hypothetical protein
MTENTAPHRHPGERTRQEKAVAWAVHHAPELAIVATPLAAGWLWNAWLDLGSLLLAGLWAANEIRLRHRTRPARQAAVTTAAPPPQLTTTTADAAAPAETAGTDRKEAQA